MSEPIGGAVRVRVADPGDGAAVAAVYAPYVEETAISFELTPPAGAEMKRRIAERLPTHPWLVAELGGRVVGYAYAGRFRPRSAYDWAVEVTVYADRTVHGRGVGKTLYRALLSILTRQGFVSAYAIIALPNSASVALHESLGFDFVGVLPAVGWKLGAWHDDGIWHRALRPATGELAPPIPFDAWRVRDPMFAEGAGS